MSFVSHEDGFVFEKKQKTPKPTGEASFSLSTLLFSDTRKIPMYHGWFPCVCTMADFLDSDLMPYVSRQFPIQCFVASLFHSSVSAEVDAARAKFVGRIILRILSEVAPMQNRVQTGLHVLFKGYCGNLKGCFLVLMLPHRCCYLVYFLCVRHNDPLGSARG